jgi:tetratricopeptide (TPR) repeat protein
MRVRIREILCVLGAAGLALALLPAEAGAYINAGFRSQKEYDEYLAQQKERERQERRAAVEDAVRRNPDDPVDYYIRGNFYWGESEWSRALADYDKAISLDPKYRKAYLRWAEVYRARGDSAKALADYEQAARLDPPSLAAELHLAWAYANLPGDKVRSPARAVVAAKRACELAGYKHPECLQVLAAACAEAGDFDAAVKWQEQALERLDRPDTVAEGRLQSYRRGKTVVWSSFDLDLKLSSPAGK